MRVPTSLIPSLNLRDMLDMLDTRGQSTGLFNVLVASILRGLQPASLPMSHLHHIMMS